METSVRKSPTQQEGDVAEQVAEAYLLDKGMTTLTRNYRCNMGEIDLIMMDRNRLVFVEVKKRKNNRFGHAAECVTPSKQRKILKTAQNYMLRYKLGDRMCRFDVVGITQTHNTRDIEWIPNAFGGA